MLNERRLVYWCFVILGAAGLLPWNIFITAHSYFSYKLRNVTATTGPTDHSEPAYLQATFEAWFTIVGSSASLLGAIVNLFLAQSVSNARRMLSGQLLVLLSLAAAAAMSLVDTDRMQTAFFATTLVLIAVANFCASGPVGGSAMGLAARLPVSTVQGAVLGQALVGVALSVVSVAAGAATPHPTVDGMAYFVAGFLFMALSLAAYFAAVNTEFVKELALGAHNPLLADDTTGDEVDEDETEENYSDEEDAVLMAQPPQRCGERVFKVVRVIKYECANIVIAYAGTLAVFPAVMSLVRPPLPAHPQWDKYFTPVLCFVLFNTGDSMGRFLTGWLQWPGQGSGLTMLLLVTRMCIIIPLVSMCNVAPGARHYMPTLLPEPWHFAALVAAVALSNGYFVCLENMHGAKRVGADDMETAGSALAVFCIVGVIAGAALSFILVHFL